MVSKVSLERKASQVHRVPQAHWAEPDLGVLRVHPAASDHPEGRARQETQDSRAHQDPVDQLDHLDSPEVLESKGSPEPPDHLEDQDQEVKK